jgi:hypothetical protein
MTISRKLMVEGYPITKQLRSLYVERVKAVQVLVVVNDHYPSAGSVL